MQDEASVRIEIISVGNELLIGKVVNTNASWMAKRATSLGTIVRRITVISDDVDEISTAVREAIKRKPRFIITTGGLGPTFDDKTLEGLARALKQNLKVNEKALDMVKKRYEEYRKQGRMIDAELTAPRVKMATVPENAKPLHNPVGTAPAAIMNLRGTVLIALPGVPSEMEAIFEESIVPMLKKEAGGIVFFEASIFADSIMESTLAPLIDKVMHSNAYVYIKSHPKSKENTPHIELHFSTTAKDEQTAKERIGKAIAQLSALTEANSGKIRTKVIR
ncbi:MAG TPA: nicotinamide mononucleotide deamidase-related protein [Candidatus Eisenbacteria bacterium]|jgi:molybdenum cofactor synthesis domain-containing protein|nr:nicotinamide mononucleotide deamidase-related protein [Candidatus Eisenbacteria bacterium]